MRSLFPAAALIALLAACGTKGPLVLPPKPQTAPPPTPAAASPADNSSKTPAEAAR